MKKTILTICAVLLLSSCDDYTKCPVSAYEVHDLIPIIYHDTYWWKECNYCGLQIRESYESDYLEVQNPKTKELHKFRKSTFYPRYHNEYELKQ